MNKMLMNMYPFSLIFLTIILSTKNETTMSKSFTMNMLNYPMIFMSVSLLTVVTYNKFNKSSKYTKLKSLYISTSIIVLSNLVFMSEDKLSFFVLFESSMIPMMMSVFYLSKSKEKIESCMYMMMMNMAGSMPFLMFIMKEMKNNSSSLNEVMMLNQSKINETMMTMFFMLMMLTKIPMFLMHVWLPKAHVEASTIGSMILAGIMLKLGLMGLMKNMSNMTEKIMQMKWMLMSISWYSVITCMVMSMRSVDVKKMSAISSISHMGMSINSLISFKESGLTGSMMMGASHGLVSSVMFFLIGLMYENTESRSILMNKSTESYNKQMSMWWVATLFMNVGIPPMSSFFSEIFMMICFSSLSMMSTIFIMISMFLISMLSMMFMTKNIFMKLMTSSVLKIKNSANNFLSLMIMENIIMIKLF